MNVLPSEKNNFIPKKSPPRNPSYSKFPNTTELDLTDVFGVKGCELNNNHISNKLIEKKNLKKTKLINPDYLSYMIRHKNDFSNPQPPILSPRNGQWGSDLAVADRSLPQTDKRNPSDSVYEIRKKYTIMASQVQANEQDSRYHQSICDEVLICENHNKDSKLPTSQRAQGQAYLKTDLLNPNNNDPVKRRLSWLEQMKDVRESINQQHVIQEKLGRLKDNKKVNTNSSNDGGLQNQDGSALFTGNKIRGYSNQIENLIQDLGTLTSKKTIQEITGFRKR